MNVAYIITIGVIIGVPTILLINELRIHFKLFPKCNKLQCNENSFKCYTKNCVFWKSLEKQKVGSVE